MHSLARYSRSSQINEEWIQEYLNIAHSQGLTSIRAHFNVLAWSSDKEELRQIKNDVGSALALMECHPRHNTIDAATLYWAGIPGNAADFPAEESFYTFIEPALYFFTAETNYKDSLSPFGIKMADRLSGKPIHLDISDLPKKVSSRDAGRKYHQKLKEVFFFNKNVTTKKDEIFIIQNRLSKFSNLIKYMYFCKV